MDHRTTPVSPSRMRELVDVTCEIGAGVALFLTLCALAGLL